MNSSIAEPARFGARCQFMFQRSTRRCRGFAGAFSDTLRNRARSLLLALSVFIVLRCAAADQTLAPKRVLVEPKASHFVANVAQFRLLSGVDYLDGCDFALTGVVTLLDAERDLVVLQDATGAVALNFRLRGTGLHFGQLVSLSGTNCCPYCARFPDYPFWPSAVELRSSFEAPMNCGGYYLARMRGYLHPPVTGEYTFWIASDNSSELWLSTDATVSKARKIAFIPRFGWVAPHEWTRFPSQQSEPILLKSEETYYIEALHEQTTVADHLAIAWQGPAIRQSIIGGLYLTPWCDAGDVPPSTPTGGMLREFWTNYTAGDLTELGGARPLQSILSVRHVGVVILGQGALPKPEPMVLGQPWPAEDNYRWVTIEGVVKFIGAQGNAVCFELAGEPAPIQVRAPRLSPAFLQEMRNARVQVAGVCEGVHDKSESLVPGVIWVGTQSGIRLSGGSTTNSETATAERGDTASITRSNNPAMQGFYGTRGVVTFNDRVWGRDYLVVQEEDSAVLVSGGETSAFQNRLKVGDWVELGGALQPGKDLAVLAPLVITGLGEHVLPLPNAEPLGLPVPASRAGKWSELEGVAHSVNSNGTVSVLGKDGPVYFWVGATSATDLARYVDGRLRARGVLLLNTLDAPALLVPSREFVDVVEAAPEDPFAIPVCAIAGLVPESMTASWRHRARVAGQVTYQDARSFVMQDASGGIHVLGTDRSATKVGDAVEAVGFPTISGTARSLNEALVRPAKSVLKLSPKALDLSEALSSKQNGVLVSVAAVLLARRTNGSSQVLELQEQQRVFAASLPTEQGGLPNMLPGSRLQVIGVCDNESAVPSPVGNQPALAPYIPSLNILLRSPADVTVLSGPPWWTWRWAALLVGTLLAILVVTLLWVHLLRRRLERQQAAQLAFSRNVLERLEEERRRISANLHDGLGQMLLVIKSQAIWVTQGTPEEAGWRERLDEIGKATSQAIDEVRRITLGLRPYQLDRLGLTQAIRTLITRASENSPILFASRVEDIDRLFDKDDEIHVYRIVQETVNNIVKHSGATEAAVVLKKRAGAVSLSIRDNGRGFDSAKPSDESHDLGYGLKGIAERVRILGGALTIDARPGAGTSTTVDIPLSISSHDTGSNSSDRG